MKNDNFRVKLFLILFFFIPITSCVYIDHSRKLVPVLEQAGANKEDLQAVIDHYREDPADSLKLKAAYFLIRNMPGHYTATSKKLDLFDSVFFSTLSSMKNLEHKYDDPAINSQIMQKRVLKIWKDLAEIYGDPSTFSTSPVPDIQAMTSQLLIENIDYAFKALEFPWTSHLTFEQFCEYVLPYRFGDEPLESWRPYFLERYKWVVDSVKDPTDPVEVCKLINNDITSWLMEGGGAVYKKHPRELSPSQLVNCKVSYCLQQGASASFAMRAMGLAIAREKIPQWGNRSTGHEFSSVLSKNGKFVDFLGGVLPPGKNEIYNKPPKIYRETFSAKQFPSEKKQQALNLPGYIDVTDEYALTSAVTIEVPKKIRAKELYLCIFDNKNWVPVQCAPVHKGKCVFSSVGRDIVYLPVYSRNRSYIPAGDPFLLAKDGKKKTYCPDDKTLREIKLDRKYPLFRRIIDFTKHMIGGRFQGANKPDFSDAVDLYTISSIPDPCFKSYPVKRGRWQYLRYIFPSFSADSAAGNVAEIGFKGIDDQNTESWMAGKQIGVPEITGKQFEIIFDKKHDNFITVNVADVIIDDYPEYAITIPFKKTVWMGIDLGTRYEITQIGFCPRNDTNGIYRHCTYELLYWDKQWISLGIKQGQDNHLAYSGVPENALLWLRNHTEGKEERIFAYENGKQVWW